MHYRIQGRWNVVVCVVFKNVFTCTCVCLCECMPHVCGCLWPEEAVGFPRAGITSSCEPPDMDIGNQTCPLEEQEVLLTPEPLRCNFYVIFVSSLITKLTYYGQVKWLSR